MYILEMNILEIVVYQYIESCIIVFNAMQMQMISVCGLTIIHLSSPLWIGVYVVSNILFVQAML